MLFVFRAQPAIQRATAIGFDAVFIRQAGGLIELVTVEISDIAADEILELTMFRAAFSEPDSPIAHDDLGIHHAATIGTQTSGCAPIGVIADGHQLSFMVLIGGISSTSCFEKICLVSLWGTPSESACACTTASIEKRENCSSEHECECSEEQASTEQSFPKLERCVGFFLENGESLLVSSSIDLFTPKNQSQGEREYHKNVSVTQAEIESYDY